MSTWGGDRRRLVLGTVLLVGACRGVSPPPPPPNVLLISVDTLRADRLNAYGYEARETSPNFDALATEGVLFQVHVAASPWTTPSHLSLLTGLTPTRHGVIASFSELYEALQGNGSVPRLAEEIPTLGEVLRDAGWATAAFTGGVTLDPRIGFDQGFDEYDTSMVKINANKVQRLLDWIDAREEAPFFLFWHTFHVHAPYLDGRFLSDVVEPERARQLARGMDRLARQPGWKDVGAGMTLMQRFHVYDATTTGAAYDGGIRGFDDFLGVLVEGLKRRGVYDRTLILLTSDHGEQLGERSGSFYNVHGHNVYEEMVRVPLVVKLPGGREAGRQVGAVTRSIDVMPTLLELLGLPAPPGLQGASLTPLLEGRSGSGGRAALSEALNVRNEAKGLRTQRHKLIVSIDEDGVRENGRQHLPDPVPGRLLFDLRRDPGELSDLLAGTPDAETLELADALERELRRQIAEAGTAGQATLDPGVREGLRALGYVQ